ncbi:hypothetical protein FRB95_005346 [Tulasnella sp. JGI-2019a]|nr:hypothetical protein FRB95_005346 [Tulasnella sp. JGI-2019a]
MERMGQIPSLAVPVLRLGGSVWSSISRLRYLQIYKDWPSKTCSGLSIWVFILPTIHRHTSITRQQCTNLMGNELGFLSVHSHQVSNIIPDFLILIHSVGEVRREGPLDEILLLWALNPSVLPRGQTTDTHSSPDIAV